jgi:hypothetical protein
MPSVVLALLAFLAEGFRSRRSLQLEILVLWHQLAVYQRSVARARIQPSDRLFWSWLVCLWSGWQDVLALVQPRTVVALAPEAVPGALEAIEPTQHARPACNSAGGPRADPDDVAEQSDLGRTTDRRRITEAGHRRGQIDRGAVSGAATAATPTDVEGVLEQSRQGRGCHGFLCGAARDVQGTLCPGHPGT